MYQKPRTIILLVLCTVIGLSAVSAEDTGSLPNLNDVLPSISEADRASLLSDGELLRFHPDGVSPGLLPNTDLTAGIARQIIAGDLNIGIEGLFFTGAGDLPSGYTNMTATDRELILYNIFRSVSTLQGLEYYSASRDEMRLLFEESWVIADVKKTKEALPDPLVNSIPGEETILIHQKDKSFGSNQSEMTFRSVSDAMAADLINISTMRYKGIFRVVDPENMQIHLIVVPVEEGLLMYGTMSAQTRNVKAFIDRARNSFTNRVIALTGWYKTRLVEEFAG